MSPRRLKMRVGEKSCEVSPKVSNATAANSVMLTNMERKVSHLALTALWQGATPTDTSRLSPYRVLQWTLHLWPSTTTASVEINGGTGVVGDYSKQNFMINMYSSKTINFSKKATVGRFVCTSCCFIAIASNQLLRRLLAPKTNRTLPKF